MTALVFIEHENGAIRQPSRSAIAALAKLGDVHVLLAGTDLSAAATAAASIAGVAKVLTAEDAVLADSLAEPLAALLQALAGEYSHVAAAATAAGKNALPRAAALLDAQVISDIVGVEGADTFIRPIYAGNALATVKSKDPVKVLTVRAAAFPPAEPTGGSASTEAAPAAALDAAKAAAAKSRHVSYEIHKSERPELSAARVVVSGGRGMAASEHFKLLEPIADKLGAAIGASRAAVDSGFVPNDRQVGQTGTIVAPELYIAIGISGAIQHLAGMKDSKVIVAINKDEEAPIFQVADYGLVADLFKAVPELDAELAKA